MGALFQSVATQLGQVGGDAAAARDNATIEKNKVQQQQFAQAQRVKEFVEQQKMDDLQTQVQQSLMKSRERGTWDPLGQPSRNTDGTYSQMERHSTTGEFRLTPLPKGFTPTNKYEDDLNELDDAYVKATGSHMPQSLKDQYLANKAGEPKPNSSEVSLAVEAFKRDHGGREPTLKEYDKIVEDIHKRTAATGSDSAGMDELSQAVASRAMPLTEVPIKERAALLVHMKAMGLSLPNQLPAGVESDLQNRSIAMQRALELIDSITPNLKYLSAVKGASLAYLAENPSRLENLVSMIYGKTFSTKDQDNIDQLSGDLKEFNEQINIIRKLLGATAFRGKEGMQQLMGVTAQPLVRPGVNAEVLTQTRKTIQALLDATTSLLGGTDLSPSGVPQSSPSRGAGPAQGGFHRDPKTGEMVED